MIYAKRSQYGSRDKAPEDWKWVFDSDWSKVEEEKLVPYKRLFETSFKKWDKKSVVFVKHKDNFGSDSIVIPRFKSIVVGRNYLKSLGFELANNPKYMILNKNKNNEIIMHYNSINGNWTTENTVDDFIKAKLPLYEL